MEIKEILSYIPNELLRQLSVEYNVDYQVKKLDGQTMFQLLLYSMLNVKENSLRVMEEFYHSLSFKSVSTNTHEGVKYNSIRDRLVSINPSYFEAIFHYCLDKFNTKYLSKDIKIVSYDSTLLSISSKLLNDGMRLNKKGDKRYVKFSMSFSNIPLSSKIFTEQRFLSEDIALREAILSDKLTDSIVVFDRGLQARNTFEEFNKEKISFVTRLNYPIRYETIQKFAIKNNKSQRLIIEEDLEVRLFNKKGIKTNHFLRLIKATDRESGNKIYFLTNNSTFTSHQITDIYKKRWEIEVFFKFIKQHLNFSHLVSRNINGIKVMLYMTLISSILLTAYKKANNLKGYKIPKMKFAQELEVLIIKDIVSKCGGNPNLVNKIMTPD